MASNRIRPLKALVAMRERQVPRLEETLARQQRALQERQQEMAQAREQHSGCTAAEAKARDERVVLLGGPLPPDVLTTLDKAHAHRAARTASRSGPSPPAPAPARTSP